MEEDAKVFSSDITRGQKPLQNNLYKLINVAPVVPAIVRDANDYECDFQPKTGKLYVPKRRTKALIKVKTVRDIRKLFESDVCPDLAKDLEKQQNYLLKKITCGSFRSEKTKSMAISMLKCDKPISRACWQMLMNLNPHGRIHAIQYVLWNGRCIRVNGSKGGKSKFLCNYDLDKDRKVSKIENRKICNNRSGLLRSSLSIKFKPGPLSKKRILDDSYQKFNVGNITLANLPKPGLDIQPKYGIPLEPTITKFVHSLRDVNGAISEKWAEFSVSALGVIKNKEVIQNNSDAPVSFELNYKYDQRRLLMRRDVDACETEKKCDSITLHSEKRSDEDINSEVGIILSEIIDSVEISLQQDNIYADEDEQRDQSVTVSVGEVHNVPKEKPKKRFAELNRLDVTVIRLPEAPEDGISKACNNAHCSLGCVCSSLQRSFNLKQHCGRLECMFQCKCDFSKYKALDSFENDCPGLLPGLINLDNELNFNLAKEEQKFHQTVVMTGEKSIVLKSERRNWKATKRYSNFYNKMCLKNEIKRRELLAVVDVKLHLENVEPWCMVHNLYKCFCKGRFTENVSVDLVKEEVDQSNQEKDSIKNDSDIKLKSRTRTEKKSEERNDKHLNDIPKLISDIHNMDSDLFIEMDEYITCARTKQYEGRKYELSHYLNANKRILEMESNDDKLRKRMTMILSKQDYSDEQRNTSLNNSAVSLLKDNSLESHDENSLTESLSSAMMDSSSSDCPGLSMASASSETCSTPDRSILNHTTNKSKLIAWLEASYKQYKKRVDQGVFKKSLEPPKHGKVALYPWEFILTRYRERKNLFLISKEKPFRIFMAVDIKNNFFNNCINIDDIRFAELHTYPSTVKNLLTNATDLKDNFCILCGMTYCWELIGSVTKVDEQANATNVENTNNVLQFTMNQSPHKSETQESTKEADKQTAPCTIKKQSSLTELRRSRRKRTKKRKFDPSTSKNETESVNLVTTESSTDSKDPVSSDGNHSSKSQSVSSHVKQSNEKTLHVQELPEENKEIESSDTSKWFVMTVENDFSEIQFYNRGFFVKYESIIKAINVARMSGKTVRLSSQKCGDVNAGPQFGIYAIPNANEYYVFVGPYEKEESLGIETVKTFSDIMKTKRTRGVWISTQKIDNIKVIDNPLAFMPSKDAQPIRLVAVEEPRSQPSETTVIPQSQEMPENKVSNESPQKDQVKIVKPITIRKTNGFYQLASQSLLKSIGPKTYGPAKPVFSKSILQPILLKNVESQRVQNTPALLHVPSLISNPCTSTTPKYKSSVNETRVPTPKPIAEIAPHIKIVDVYSESERQTPKSVASVRPERGMLVLKPEEINKRMMEKRILLQVPLKINDNQKDQQAEELEQETEELDQDIENFLATSSVFVPPNADIFEISDEDEEDSEANKNNWKPVWIDCVNIKLGYLRGRKNLENRISFEFPGFKFTEFYDEQEAFSKINQVLSRKIFVPKRIDIQWRVAESIAELRGKKRLKAEELGSDFVLTKQGLRHKRLLMVSLRKKMSQSAPANSELKSMLTSEEKSTLTSEEIDKDDSQKGKLDQQDNDNATTIDATESSRRSIDFESTTPNTNVEHAIDIISDLDDQSKSLEEEGDVLHVLFNEMVSARGQAADRIFDIKEEDQATLQTIRDSFNNINAMTDSDNNT